MNNNNPRFQLTNLQVASIVACNLIGLGILTMPRLVVKDALQDGWIAIVMGGLILIMALLLMNRVCQRFPELTLVEMLERVFGRYLGMVLALVFICFEIFLAAVMSRIWTGIIGTYLLPKTPSTVIIAVFLLAVSYLTIEGLKNIGRICEISQYLIIPLFLVVIVTLPEADWLNLMPVGGSGIKNILLALATTGFGYSGAIIYMVIYPFNIKKEKALRAGLAGAVFVIGTYVFLVAVSIMVFGSMGIQGIRWPILELMRITTFPVIERLDFFVLLFYQLIVYRITALSIFNAGFGLAKILHLKEHRYMVLAVLPFIYTIALLPQDVFEVEKFSNWAGIVGVSIDVIFPVLLLLGAAIWVKKGESRA